MAPRRGGQSYRRGGAGGARRSARSAPRPNRKFTTVTSRKTSGVYTSRGAPVRNVQAYNKAGGKGYNVTGRYLHRPVQYADTVQRKSINAAAQRAQRVNPKAKAFSYKLHDSNTQRHYVGMTTKPTQRMQDHLSGRGAKATKQMMPTGVVITPHDTKKAAYKAESKAYSQAKADYGTQNVRGAGHTRQF